MSDMNKQLLKEQNVQELIVAAKIISSILFGLLCGLLAYFAFNGIVGFFAQASNAQGVDSGIAIACVITFVISFAVWFSCRSIVQSLRATPIQVAVITPEEEQEAQKKFQNSPSMRAIANEQSKEERNKRELQKAKILAERAQAERVRENERLAQEARETHFADRALAMSLAFKLEARTSEMVRVVTYINKRARFTVENSWHLLPYQLRLQGAQNLGNLWAKFAQTNEPLLFGIEDLNGNRVGGRSAFGVWVQKY